VILAEKINRCRTARSYDAENRLIQVGGTLGNCGTATACYAYDAEGRRIQKTVGSVVTQYVYDVAGQVIHEADGAGNFTAYYIPFAGQLLAQYKNSTTQFLHKDRLGSTRLVTGMTNPSTPVDTLDFLPFGEQLAGDTATTHKFTGKERDSESGLDNFDARYYSSSMGRFMSPDWSDDPDPIPYADLGNPQTLNLYAYVGNNPVNATDYERLAAIESVVAVENARRLLAAKLAHTHFSSEQARIGAAAAVAGITYEQLSEYLHSFKGGPHGAGRGPGDNFTWKELVAIALEAAQSYASQK